MEFTVSDFNGAMEYFETTGEPRWSELEQAISKLRPQLQASGQRGKVGVPIFDPKGTNAKLTSATADEGWRLIPVPPSLRPFGRDWDAGKGSVLAEWQFSNYPFLWNNITRTEIVFRSGDLLPPLTGPVEALVVVTKSGSFPASNSTLYYEQAKAQMDTVTTLGVFTMPIRLVGLTIEPDADTLLADWNEYPARYGRKTAITTEREFQVSWGREGQYGNRSTSLL